MSLDITIIDDRGSPQESVLLTVDEHRAFIQQAQRMQLSQWMRMSDYSEDADYAPEDVSILIQETERMKATFSEEKQVGKLREIKVLLKTAMQGREKVYAIAD